MKRDDNPFSSLGPDLRGARNAMRKQAGLVKLAAALAALVVLGIASYYQVEPDEIGVVTRFGKFIAVTDSGPHFKIPLIDTVVTVPAKRQLKEEFGFATAFSGVKSEFVRNADTLKESMMLTGDLNVAVVEWIVHYKIADPYQFVFKVRNVRETLRDLSEATLRAVVGDYSVTEVLTRGREEVLDKARTHLEHLCEAYQTGISIQRIELKDSAPPEPVRPSFNEVNQAEQERDRLQNEAWSQYNKEIPKARGEASQLIQNAEGYAVERVNRARGEADKFLAIQREYAAAPSVTRTRLYLETMSDVLPKAGKKVYVDEAVRSVLPLLLTGERMPNEATKAAATAGGAP